jgi:1-acyl-sn-glycerol-3-phosphate acyltransferase
MSKFERAFFSFTTVIIQSIFWCLFAKPFFGFFYRMKVVGLEELSGLTTPVIFAANHISEPDPILLPPSLQFFSKLKPIFFVVREPKYYRNPEIFKLKRHFYWGPLFKLIGGFPIVPGQHNYAVSLQTHLEVLRDGQGSVCIFPEGRVTKTGRIQEAHGGVGYLAQSAWVPVVPVAISGVYEMTLLEFFLRKRTLTITFGKPILPEELFSSKEPLVVESYQAAARTILGRIAALLS